jgi:replication initiation and membrane attachment protein DnaB
MACILQNFLRNMKKKCIFTGTRNSVPRSFQQTVSLETLGLLRQFVMKQERQLPLLWLHWSDLSQLPIR